MTEQSLTDRELAAWRTSIQMLELLHNRIEQQLQASAGLSNADYSVLSLLSEANEGRMRAFELAQAADWEKSRMHHQITRMCRRGLLNRERSGSRGMDVVLTPDGLAALEAAAPEHVQQVRHLFLDRISPEQLDEFAGIAGVILENLRAAETSD